MHTCSRGRENVGTMCMWVYNPVYNHHMGSVRMGMSKLPQNVNLDAYELLEKCPSLFITDS